MFWRISGEPPAPPCIGRILLLSLLLQEPVYLCPMKKARMREPITRWSHDTSSRLSYVKKTAHIFTWSYTRLFLLHQISLHLAFNCCSNVLIFFARSLVLYKCAGGMKKKTRTATRWPRFQSRPRRSHFDRSQMVGTRVMWSVSAQ